MWYKNIASRFFGLVTKHACQGRTDGRTDGQNYDSQDRASIAESRGKNCRSDVTQFTWKSNCVSLLTSLKYPNQSVQFLA